MKKPVLAAGTVCYRRVEIDGESRLMVLLVHRTKQRDVSFPKGKLDPGESMPQAAVRETLEETGLSVTLGANLGTIHYELPSGGEKTVQYWAAEVLEQAVHTSTFRPNGEISALEWVPVDKVRERLSYKADKQLFKVFTRLAERDAVDTFSIILLRHATAEPRSGQFPVDSERPLSDFGEHQAETLVPTLEAFGPERILSSPAERCRNTVTPLSQRLSKKIKLRDGLSEESWESGDISELRRIVGKSVSKCKTAVICTHRPLLPDAARELALASGSLPGDYLRETSELPPGGFSVFHFSRKHPGAGILCAETYPLKHKL